MRRCVVVQDMIEIRSSAAFLLSLTIGTVFGCDAEPSSSKLCVAPRAVVLNAVVTNRVMANGLREVALHGDISAAVASEMLDDPVMRTVLEYTVSCALDADQSVEVEHGGETLVFDGALGLAPEWGDLDGTCDETCRGWVSACLIARTNAKGNPLPISLQGEHPSLGVDENESEAFTQREGVYFGDLFTDPPLLFACLPDGATEIPRVCGDDTEGCGVTIVGPCTEACDDTGCSGPGGTIYPETITVYRDPDASSCTPLAFGDPIGNYN